MYKILFAFALSSVMTPDKLPGQSGLKMKALKKAVIEEFSSQKGDFAVAFYDLQTGKHLYINQDEVFHAASTMKVPVMIEVFNQAHRGIFRLNDSLKVENHFKSIVDSSIFQLDSLDDSYTPLYHETGKMKSIYDLTYLMIIHSSNLATDIVIDLVGAANVMKTIRQMGVKKMKVLRGVEDQKAFDLGLNNVTTAHDLMLLFKDIALGKAVSPDASDSMVHILFDQKFNEIIPALLPEDVKVAHKTGNITGVDHDAGIIFLPDGRKYILVLLSKNLENENSSIQAMARVSRLVYDFEMAQKSK